MTEEKFDPMRDVLKTTQRFITNIRYEFDKQVSYRLDEGWFVVPDTLGASPVLGTMGQTVDHVMWCVVEREEQ